MADDAAAGSVVHLDTSALVKLVVSEPKSEAPEHRMVERLISVRRPQAVEPDRISARRRGIWSLSGSPIFGYFSRSSLLVRL